MLQLSLDQPNEVSAYSLTNLLGARLCLGQRIAARLALPTTIHPTQADKNALCSTKNLAIGTHYSLALANHTVDCIKTNMARL